MSDAGQSTSTNRRKRTMEPSENAATSTVKPWMLPMPRSAWASELEERVAADAIARISPSWLAAIAGAAPVT